ncbi:hypothetical protein VTK73DRAFT_6126 [Phialemonium thermophilum]|uniref:CMP/dCMP-type deaminase domain-containing protein n=1 Tax=Phialemonium thermophilum TaxID=223376 RepID=A0ABR3WKK5_9PEZI
MASHDESAEESAATAGHNMWTFFQSFLLSILDVLRRVVGSLSTRPWSAKSPSPTKDLGEHQHQANTMSMSVKPSESKPDRPKIIPALPLVPIPGPNKKENEPPGKVSAKETQLPPSTLTTISPPGSPEPVAKVANLVAKLDLERDGRETKITSIPVDGPASETYVGEKAIHAAFMREALNMARLALQTNETPVGCVFVHRGKIIAKGMNATNITRNGTRHAELMALSALLSYGTEAQHESRHDAPAKPSHTSGDVSDGPSSESRLRNDHTPEHGHLYPYGQKLHPAPRVHRSIVPECTLYVTVEPCVMCASLLRQLGIKKVYFGAVNDKFGGTGGVFHIHMNSSTYSASSLPSVWKPSTNASGVVTSHKAVPGMSAPPDNKNCWEESRGPLHQKYKGDGGNVEPGYEAEGGWGRDEAVNLLRQFYVQENNRAPVPRKKEGRAARLAAMMEQDSLVAKSIVTDNSP